MTTCLRKSCSFGLLCVSFVNAYQLVCVSFRFGFEDGMCDLSVLPLYLIYLNCEFDV